MQVAIRSLAQRTDHTVIESLDNLGLEFDKIPELDEVTLNLLNVD